MQQDKECINCGRMSFIHGWDMCNRCYMNKYNKRKRGNEQNRELTRRDNIPEKTLYKINPLSKKQWNKIT